MSIVLVATRHPSIIAYDVSRMGSRAKDLREVFSETLFLGFESFADVELKF